MITRAANSSTLPASRFAAVLPTLISVKRPDPINLAGLDSAKQKNIFANAIKPIKDWRFIHLRSPVGTNFVIGDIAEFMVTQRSEKGLELNLSLNSNVGLLTANQIDGLEKHLRTGFFSATLTTNTPLYFIDKETMTPLGRITVDFKRGIRIGFQFLDPKKP